MKTVQVDNMNLQYDESNPNIDIERISKILNANQLLFSDYKNKTLNVDDFDTLFDNTLKSILADETFRASLNNKELLPALYIQLLVKKEDITKSTLIPTDNFAKDDILYFFAACKYYNHDTQFRELSTYLKYRNNSEELFTWLKETQRFNAYNYILGIATNYLKTTDSYFIDNLSDIIKKVIEYTTNSVIFLKNNKTIDKLPTESFKKLDLMFLDFLKKIDAPSQWLDLYDNLKKENKISFDFSYDGKDYSSCYRDEEGMKIKIINDGSIKIFTSFAHEFAHYISLQKGLSKVSILEFPSIFYEKLAANYLIEMGYDETLIQKIIIDRKENNLGIFSQLSDLLIDICKYNLKGPIKREEKINFLKDITANLHQEKLKIAEKYKITIEENELLENIGYNFEETVDNDCDIKTSIFIKEGLVALDGYQYIINSYLVDELIENNNENTLYNMAYITDNLANLNMNKILKMLNMEDVFTKKENISKIKTKKYQ